MAIPNTPWSFHTVSGARSYDYEPHRWSALSSTRLGKSQRGIIAVHGSRRLESVDRGGPCAPPRGVVPNLQTCRARSSRPTATGLGSELGVWSSIVLSFWFWVGTGSRFVRARTFRMEFDWQECGAGTPRSQGPNCVNGACDVMIHAAAGPHRDDPTTDTNTSSLPPVCFHSSGPVPSSWARTLFSLRN